MIKRERVFKEILFYIFLLIMWQILFSLGTGGLKLWKAYAFPSPIGVARKLIDMAGNGSLFVAVFSSLRRCLSGFAISLAIGSVLGVALSGSSYLKMSLKPLLSGFQSLPSICWVPFAILWFGLEESSILFVVVMGSVFSIALSIEEAFSGVPAIYIKAAKTMGARDRQIYLHVILPAAFPALLGRMQQSWSFAWRALMSGEVMSSFVGLGFSLTSGRDMGDINQVVAVMVTIIAIGIIIEKVVFGKLESRIRRKREG